ncbi:MAG TPA: NUDIX hydrolase [Ktedonobacteraceae bacterium]
MSEAHRENGDKIARGALSMGAGVVVVDNQRVLLVRNRYGVTRGRYLLPAGRVRPGEMPDRAAEREALEETGLRVQVTGLLGLRVWSMESGEQNYFLMFHARLLSPASELRPDLAEVSDARFFSRAELKQLGPDETWIGALAIVYKALDTPPASLWLNSADLSVDSGVTSAEEEWRFWA